MKPELLKKYDETILCLSKRCKKLEQQRSRMSMTVRDLNQRNEQLTKESEENREKINEILRIVLTFDDLRVERDQAENKNVREGTSSQSRSDDPETQNELWEHLKQLECKLTMMEKTFVESITNSEEKRENALNNYMSNLKDNIDKQMNEKLGGVMEYLKAIKNDQEMIRSALKLDKTASNEHKNVAAASIETIREASTGRNRHESEKANAWYKRKHEDVSSRVDDNRKFWHVRNHNYPRYNRPYSQRDAYYRYNGQRNRNFLEPHLSSKESTSVGCRYESKRDRLNYFQATRVNRKDENTILKKPFLPNKYPGQGSSSLSGPTNNDTQPSATASSRETNTMEFVVSDKTASQHDNKKIEVKIHKMRNTIIGGRFYCWCGHSTQTENGLLNHIKTQMEKKFRCPSDNCKESFHHVHVMRTHLMKVHNEKNPRLYGCNQCFRVFRTKEERTEHLNSRNVRCYKGRRIKRMGKQLWTPSATPRSSKNEDEKKVDEEIWKLCELN